MDPNNNQKNGNPASVLGRGMPDLPTYDPSYTYVSYTISLPETKKFMKLPALFQKIVYHNILKSALDMFVTKVQPFVYNQEFEFTRKGKVHVHGFIKFKNINVIEFVNDLSKFLCKSISMYRKGGCRFNVSYNHNNFLNNDHGVTYKSPALFLDHMVDEEAFNQWTSYMYKQYEI